MYRILCIITMLIPIIAYSQWNTAYVSSIVDLHDQDVVLSVDNPSSPGQNGCTVRIYKIINPCSAPTDLVVDYDFYSIPDRIRIYNSDMDELSDSWWVGDPIIDPPVPPIHHEGFKNQLGDNYDILDYIPDDYRIHMHGKYETKGRIRVPLVDSVYLHVWSNPNHYSSMNFSYTMVPTGSTDMDMHLYVDQYNCQYSSQEIVRGVGMCRDTVYHYNFITIYDVYDDEMVSLCHNDDEFYYTFSNEIAGVIYEYDGDEYYPGEELEMYVTDDEISISVNYGDTCRTGYEIETYHLPESVMYLDTTVLYGNSVVLPDYDMIDSSGIYMGSYVDENGCDSYYKYDIKVIRKNFYAPNAISPNGDSKDDCYQLYFTDGLHVIYEWQIYDRWGGSIAVGFNNDPWCPDDTTDSGVYVGIFIITYGDGETETMTTEINVLK